MGNIQENKYGINGNPVNEQHFSAHPITDLCGSSSVAKEILNCLNNSIPFALCAIDIDNLSAYNSFYNYEKGDELIKYTAKVAKSAAVKFNGDDFLLAHIGGDNFILIVAPDKCEVTSKAIANAFDENIADYYDGDEKENKSITIYDRKNRERIFPFASLTIVTTTPATNKHIGEIAESLQELIAYGKKNIQRNFGSIFVCDRRL